MNREELEVQFKKAKEGLYDFLAVTIKTPTNVEIVLVPYEYLNVKLDFYKSAYKPNLEHIMNGTVKIIGAKPMMSNDVVEILEELEKQSEKEF